MVGIMRECDLHGLKFEDGRQKIIRILNDCVMKNEDTVHIIHGYHGHTFKDYIRSAEFIEDMECEGIYVVKRCSTSNPGVTEITIEL